MNRPSYKSECPGGTGQNAEQNTNAVIVAPAEILSKQYETLRARCALAGITLHQIETDYGKRAFIVSRWALTRELADLEAVGAWLEKVSGVKSC